VQPLHKPVTGFGAKLRLSPSVVRMQVVHFRMERPMHDYEAAHSLKFQMWKISRNACWAMDSAIIRNAQKKNASALGRWRFN